MVGYRLAGSMGKLRYCFKVAVLLIFCYAFILRSSICDLQLILIFKCKKWIKLLTFKMIKFSD